MTKPTSASAGIARLAPALPLLGWALLAAGPWLPTHPLVHGLWWLVAFLHGVVHPAQLPLALPRARAAGVPLGRTLLWTVVFGATWWRRLPAPPTT